MSTSQEQEIQQEGTSAPSAEGTETASGVETPTGAEAEASGAASDTAAAETASGEEASGESKESSSQPETDYAREYSDMKDKYLRLFAEFENFRRRTTKENFELVAAANAKLLGKLTEVLDDFNLAFDPRRKAGSPEDFEKGVRLIHAKLRDLLADEGLEEVNPAGEEFDPNVHDALLQQPSDTVPENRILEVVQKGWRVKHKDLKHAKVIVSKGPAEPGS